MSARQVQARHALVAIQVEDYVDHALRTAPAVFCIMEDPVEVADRQNRQARIYCACPSQLWSLKTVAIRDLLIPSPDPNLLETCVDRLTLRS